VAVAGAADDDDDSAGSARATRGEAATLFAWWRERLSFEVARARVAKAERAMVDEVVGVCCWF
jgi:hypothetical protein